MTNSKHTPGPWKRDKYGHVVDGNGKSVVFRSVTNLCAGDELSIAEAECNTDLIARAPDLLAENERLQSVNAEMLAALKSILLDGDSFSRLVARAAILKAKAGAK